MVRSLQIQGLRGIREGNLVDLTPLRVLVGPNGSGKSTVLDALFIAANPTPGEAILKVIARRRGLRRGIEWLVRGVEDERRGRIIIESVSAERRVCHLHIRRIGGGVVVDATLETVDASSGTNRHSPIHLRAAPRTDGSIALEGDLNWHPLETIPSVSLTEP